MIARKNYVSWEKNNSPLVGCGGVAAPSASSSSHRRPGGANDRATPDYRTCQARICCHTRHLPLVSSLENDVPGTRRERRPTTMWRKRCGRSLVHYQPAPRFFMVHSATEESNVIAMYRQFGNDHVRETISFNFLHNCIQIFIAFDLERKCSDYRVCRGLSPTMVCKIRVVSPSCRYPAKFA